MVSVAAQHSAGFVGTYGLVDQNLPVRFVPDCHETNSPVRELTAGDLAKISDPYTRISLQLQAAFGLRRGESIKIRPEWADRGDKLALKDTWTQGWPCAGNTHPQRGTAPDTRRGQALCRQGQPDSG